MECEMMRFIGEENSSFYAMCDYLEERCQVVHRGGYYSIQVDSGSPDNDWYFHFSNSTLYLCNEASDLSEVYFGAFVGENEDKSKLENLIKDFCKEFPQFKPLKDK